MTSHSGSIVPDSVALYIQETEVNITYQQECSPCRSRRIWSFS